jgi:hypothetical protein
MEKILFFFIFLFILLSLYSQETRLLTEGMVEEHLKRMGITTNINWLKNK